MLRKNYFHVSQARWSDEIRKVAGANWKTKALDRKRRRDLGYTLPTPRNGLKTIVVVSDDDDI